MILGFAMMFAVLNLVPVGQRSALLFFSSVGILYAGLIVLVVLGYVVGVRYFEKGLVVPPEIVDSFRQIGPDKAFETRKFLVFKKNGIYILLPKELFIGVYFVRLFREAKVSGNDKVKLPFRRATGFIRKGRFQDEVNGLSVAKSRGGFVVPTGAVKLSERDYQESYMKGPGILYFVFRYDLKGVAIYPGGYIGMDRLISVVHHRPRFDLCDRFDRATILEIMERLSKEKLKN
jgi:hypothetical protein